MFAQLESQKAKEASAFLGLAEGEAFPYARGVDRLDRVESQPNAWAGWLEKNRRQQGICLPGMCTPAAVALREVLSIPGAVTVLLAELFCFSWSVLFF